MRFRITANLKETLWSIDTFANRLLLDQNTLFYYTRNTAGLEGIGAVDVKTGQSKWTYTLKTNERVAGVLAAGGNRLYANIQNPVQMTSKIVQFQNQPKQIQ